MTKYRPVGSDGPEPMSTAEGNIAPPVLFLVDLDFFVREFFAAREFYSDLYSGNSEDFPAKQLPEHISTATLQRAIMHFCRADPRHSRLFVFGSERVIASQVLITDSSAVIETVRGLKTYAMLEVLGLHETFETVVLVADDEGYDLLLQSLMMHEVNLLLIKHRQEDDDDVSHMPTDIRYQYADYIAGLTLGLTLHEL